MNSKNNHLFHSINSTNLHLNYMHSFNNSKNIGRRIRHSILSKNSNHFSPPELLESTIIQSKYNSKLFQSTNVKKDISDIKQKSTCLSSRRNISYFESIHNSINVSKLGDSYISPKKLTTSIIKSQEKISSHHKLLTITCYNEKKTQSKIKIPEEKRLFNLKQFRKETKLDKIKVNSLLKTIKFQLNKKLDFKIKTNNNKNKTLTDKIKNSKNNILKVETKKFVYKNKRKHQNIFCMRLVSNKRKCELCNKLIDNFLYKLHYFSHPSEILNWIYLGNSKNANNIEDINNFRISYVLNCALEVHDRNLPKHIKYCHLQLIDTPETEIIIHFEKSFNFIESARKEGKKILIHCKLGISRSPTILMAYLIRYMNFTALSALDFVKTKRKQVQPNPGFFCQLCSFEKNISKNKKNSLNHSTSQSTSDFSSSRNTRLIQK